MAKQQDPVQERGEGHDLYEIATWDPRSGIDTLSMALYSSGLTMLRAIVVVLAVLILLIQFVLGGLAVIIDPVVGMLIILSVVPALAIAAYIWYIDITKREPLSLLVATFILAVLFAGFAAVINAVGIVPFSVGAGLVEQIVPALGEPASFVALALFFFVIVGPVEEAVKLLAVRLYAYRSDRFDAVINGAVYGAAAGLGFATIENALYIARGLETGATGLEIIGGAGDIAAVRALAGPGHVLYSAIAGFYLGLAKFNPDYAGPIIVKGLLIAAVFHALYNTLVGAVPGAIAGLFDPISTSVALFVFVVVYLGAVGYFLYRKIEGYRRAYREVGV